MFLSAVFLVIGAPGIMIPLLVPQPHLIDHPQINNNVEHMMSWFMKLCNGRNTKHDLSTERAAEVKGESADAAVGALCSSQQRC